MEVELTRPQPDPSDRSCKLSAAASISHGSPHFDRRSLGPILAAMPSCRKGNTVATERAPGAVAGQTPTCDRLRARTACALHGRILLKSEPAWEGHSYNERFFV